MDVKSFSQRICDRHRAYWSSPDAEAVVRKKLSFETLLSLRRTEAMWQRALSNKINATRFVSGFGYEVPKLYWSGVDLREIDFESMPDAYVVKPVVGHSAIGVFPVRRGSCIWGGEQVCANRIMASAHAHGTGVEFSEFMVEELLVGEDGGDEVPLDYKVYSFNGNVACVQVIRRNGRHIEAVACYSTDWVLLPPLSSSHDRYEVLHSQPPRCLPEILRAAAFLSAMYRSFVRLDFYATYRGAVFGEFTSTPRRGLGFTQSADDMLSSFWDRFCADAL